MKLKSWDIRALDELEKYVDNGCDIDFSNYTDESCPMNDSAKLVLALIDTLLEAIDELEDEARDLENKVVELEDELEESQREEN